MLLCWAWRKKCTKNQWICLRGTTCSGFMLGLCDFSHMKDVISSIKFRWSFFLMKLKFDQGASTSYCSFGPYWNRFILAGPSVRQSEANRSRRFYLSIQVALAMVPIENRDFERGSSILEMNIHIWNATDPTDPTMNYRPDKLNDFLKNDFDKTRMNGNNLHCINCMHFFWWARLQDVMRIFQKRPDFWDHNLPLKSYRRVRKEHFLQISRQFAGHLGEAFLETFSI